MKATSQINRVVVLGGRGFIGQNLVPELRSAGYEVYTADRSKSTGNHIQVELLDSDKMHRALKGFDALINLVGLTPIMKAKNPTYHDVHVKGVMNIIDAAKANRIKRVIFITVHGANSDSPLQYFQTKGLAEELIRNSGLNYSIVRPSFVFGHGSEFENLAHKLRYLLLLPFPKFNATVYPIYVKDLARIITKQLGREEPTTINALGPQKISVYEMVRKQFKENGITLLPLPGGVFASLFRLISPLPFIPLSKDIFSFMRNSIKPEFGGGETVRGKKEYTRWLSEDDSY